ncbi:MAG TPA: hypothetical protein VFT29_02150 [Gemmatimonadaceae bacterium]|nr:hypothetical protein [Gemmatimonadaceae bacterium]
MKVHGTATAYRLYDVGYEIDLDWVASLLGADTRGRTRPARTEAQAFRIRNPPLSAALGERELVSEGKRHVGQLAAHVFDFGVCSLRFTVPGAPGCSWSDFTSFGSALDQAPELTLLFERELRALAARIAPAVQRPRVAPVVEEYVVFRIQRLEVDGGRPATDVLTDEYLGELLLGERRALSIAARKELLGNRFSYYADDLAVLTWDNALVVEPRESDFDVEFVLEFANAQLLEFRVYDAELDAELPALYSRIAAARRRRRPSPTFRFGGVLSDMQTRVADITEVVERADNALKVMDDVYLARIYEKALALFRERSWRSGIDRKLGIFRDTYAMLNDEAQTTRAELLELAIVVLIVVEIVLGLSR